MTYKEFLKYARGEFAAGSAAYFCPVAYSLHRARIITIVEAKAFTERIHRALHPTKCTNYYDWMEENHPASYDYMVDNDLQMDARLAWCDHLIASEPEVQP